MASKTSGCEKYQVKIGKARITIIDTPGFGDSRGIKIDDEHVQKIQDCILAERGINAIIIVQNGRDARFNTQLMYSYTTLINILPQDISRQIVMVYTNCSKKSELNFDHSTLNKIFGIDQNEVIPFVCIDNPLVYMEKEKIAQK